MAKCLVLGGNGFLGSHIVDTLSRNDHQIIVFDRFNPSLNLRFKQNHNIDLFEGDFLNRHDISQALKGVDYVFHFISTTTPITSDEDPMIDIETNIRMSVELLQECVTVGRIKKVIFASTGGAIYGQNSKISVSEEVLPLPVSPYAIGKLTIEHYLRYFRIKFGLNNLVYRISNPYGDRQSLISKQGVIPIFLNNILLGKKLDIWGDGNMIRDYLYVGDAAEMIVRSFENARQDLYNLGSGKGYSVNEIVDTIRKVVDMPISIKHNPMPATFVQNITLDISRYTQEFGVNNCTSLENGIQRTWDYIKSQS